MVGVVPAGLTVVGPETEVAIRVPGDEDRRRALARALAGDPGPADPTLPPAELERLAARLDELGAYDAPTAVPAGVSLAAAIAAARRGAPPEGAVWTADEALLLPAGLPEATRMLALRRFVGGLRPDGRLEAYAAVARGEGAVHGDVPAPGAPGTETAAPPGSAIAVLELTGEERRWSVAPDDLERIGAAEPHRLGPILRTSEPEPIVPDDGGGGLWHCVAEVAVANLNVATPALDRLVQGAGDRKRARLVAHAEGAERYAAAEPADAELVHAAAAELTGAIEPHALYARTPGAPAEEAPRLWAPVEAADGTPHWVPAETVYASIVAPCAPGAELPWTSSGTAAHPSAAEARRRAIHELIERDAFVWTWIRRVSRERVSTRSVPPDVARLADELARHGWSTAWVNLSLDTAPVILCCATHPSEGLAIGAASDTTAPAALRRATVEALILALRFRRGDAPLPAPADVRTPRDHLLLHRDPARRDAHGFLFAAGEEVELGDIPGSPGDGAERMLEEVGHPVVAADLTHAACAPFAVVRALAPGLLPLTFGFEHEPIGMLRARSGIRTRDGRLLGGAPRSAGGDILPHPFP